MSRIFCLIRRRLKIAIYLCSEISKPLLATYVYGVNI
jgi:hypothetical protein